RRGIGCRDLTMTPETAFQGLRGWNSLSQAINGPYQFERPTQVPSRQHSQRPRESAGDLQCEVIQELDLVCFSTQRTLHQLPSFANLPPRSIQRSGSIPGTAAQLFAKGLH